MGFSLNSHNVEHPLLVTMNSGEVWKRVGYMDIDVRWLAEQEPSSLTGLFSQFFPFDMECIVSRYDIESESTLRRYYGYSPNFDPIQPGGILPEYELTISQKEGKLTTYTWKKIEK